MHILNINDLSVNHAGRVIFRGLNWAIGDRDRVGLVGPNGAGKSSLFKAIVGVVEPASGMIIRQRGLQIGYLPQEPELTHGRTVLTEANQAPPQLAAVEAALAEIDTLLSDPTIYGDEKALTRVLDRQEQILATYERLGGPGHAGRVKAVLHQLGFTPDHFDLPVESLSGGQKKLVALARLVLAAPQLLLLDEPDNHLDLTAKRRLEAFLAGFQGSVVVISHDRYLLDEVVTQIAELDSGRLTLYSGNYTSYTNERTLNRLRQQQMYAAQQQELDQLKAAIARFELWGKIYESERSAKQAKSRRKMLERMEAQGQIVERVTERRTMAVQFDGWRGSSKVVELKQVAMGFDDDLLFIDLDLLLRHGERVGLIGPNGAGKSVLFSLILGQREPLSGIVKLGPSIRIGYYSQEHQTLAEWLQRTPIERIREIEPMTEGTAVSFLGKFLFSYEQTQQPIHTLSGGERSRLQLAVLMRQRPNLLLLDEPTNNLDIPSVEALEAALESFEGTILTISHDRYFLDQTVDRVVELADGTLTAFEGGYTDYLLARRLIK